MASQMQQEVNQTEYASEDPRGGTPPPKKLGGVFFWMVLGIAIADDLSDFVFTAINLALTATIAAIPIAIFLFLIGIFISIAVFVLMQVYFITHGGLHRSAQIKRFVAWFFAIFCEMIPILQLLPTTTILFVLIAWLENTIRKHNLLTHAMQFGVDKNS